MWKDKYRLWTKAQPWIICLPFIVLWLQAFFFFFLALQPLFLFQKNGDDTLIFVVILELCKSTQDCVCHVMHSWHNYMLVPFHMHFLYMEEFSRVVIFEWELRRQNRYILESLGKLSQNTCALEIQKDSWGRNSSLYFTCVPSA